MRIAANATKTNDLLLGVDVGNSKTHIAITSLEGKLVGSADGPGLMSLPAEPALQLRTLLALVDEAIGHHTGFAAACFAMAGLDLPVEEERMASLVRAANISERSVVCNDTFALLRTGSASGDGIAVVAGAGINCVGVFGERSVRFHSFGKISGDWGGGQDVGEEALAVACRAEDGRGAPTLLVDRIPQYFGLDRPLQVTEAIQVHGMRRSRLVELAPVTFDAAADGDSAAIAIVRRLADEVIIFIETALARLDAAHARLAVTLGGGLLQSGNGVLLERIHAAPTLARTEISIAAVPPIVGTILLAADSLPGAALDADDVARHWAKR